MSISVDVGTYNLVSCKRGKNNEFEYKKKLMHF